MASPEANPDLSASAVEVDHISHLPDAIIHHIFSFLPFKDVVKTSVLSKQWRLVWTSTPYIHLSLSSWRVVPSINRALSLCKATKVEKFHLHVIMCDIRIPAELDQWFRFAVARKVEDASLVFGRWYCDVPRILCDCPSLVSLRVSGCIFSRDLTIHWPSLKKLCIHDFILDYLVSDKDVIMKIMRGCPVLESLTLRSSRPGRCNLRIDSRSLRELVIEADYIQSLNISAPNLLSLSGGVVFSLFLTGVSSLAEAELNFKQPTAYRWKFSRDLRFLLMELQHVAKITIGSWCLQVLSTMAVKGWPYLSSRWRNVVVYTTVCKRELQGMTLLLHISPQLERLTICNPKSNNVTFKKKDFHFVEKQFWR